MSSVHTGKLVLVGEPATGKTAFTQMLLTDGRKFPSVYNMKYGFQTCGVDVHSKRIRLTNTEEDVGLLILDSAGNDLYKDFLGQYWDHANLLLVMYDVTSESSFNNVESWMYKAMECTWGQTLGPPTASALFANKCDLLERRIVSKEKGEELAEKLDMPYFEGSVKEYEGLDSVIQYLAKEWISFLVDKQKTRRIPLSKSIFNNFQSPAAAHMSPIK